ncbi:MAG: transposase [bacterium]
MSVIRSVTVKLQLLPCGASALRDTMRAYTEAFTASARWGFANHTYNKVRNHAATYRDVRTSIPNLPSSLVQGARDCACDALKATKCTRLPERRPFAAIRYNQRVVRVSLLHGFASIATTSGRVRAEFTLPDCYRQYVEGTIKSSTLSYTNRHFYLHVQIELPTPNQTDIVRVLGIDRGMKNVAVCSDSSFFNARTTRAIRGRHQHLRADLQSKGTRSAKRKLKRLSGRERRFMTDINHCISKQIANSEYTIFALEDLSKIRVQKRRGTEFNRNLNGWSFYQLEQFLRYKSESLGKSVVLVDARYTSQKCSKCGHVYKGNRHGSQFICRNCGFELHADLNAARNIAHAGISGVGRLPVNQPNVACL